MLSFQENEKRVLEKRNEKLRRNYGKQNAVVGRTAAKLVKSGATCFVAMATSSSRAILKRFWREISELGYFNEYLQQNWTGRRERLFGININIGDEEAGISLDPFLLVGAGTYERSFTSQSTMLVEIARTHSDSA